jgi:phage shock protein A
MGLFQRMGDIISANLHEMIDRFEDPQAMLKQAIREMEQAIAQSLDRAVEVIASEKLLARQVAENREAVSRWQQAAVRAVPAGDDSAARRALARKGEHEKLLAALEAERQAAEQTAARLRCQIGAMRAKLAEARRRLATLAARQHLAATRSRRARTVLGVGDAGFERFQCMVSRLEQAEAEADAREELCGSWASFEADEEENLQIERELSDLKASCGAEAHRHGT